MLDELPVVSNPYVSGRIERNVYLHLQTSTDVTARRRNYEKRRHQLLPREQHLRLSFLIFDQVPANVYDDVVEFSIKRKRWLICIGYRRSGIGATLESAAKAQHYRNRYGEDQPPPSVAAFRREEAIASGCGEPSRHDLLFESPSGAWRRAACHLR